MGFLASFLYFTTYFTGNMYKHHLNPGFVTFFAEKLRLQISPSCIDSVVWKEVLHRAPQPRPLNNHSDRRGVFSSVPLEGNFDALKDAHKQENQTGLLSWR